MLMKEFYSNISIRKMKLRLKINSQRTNSNLFIIKTYGKDKEIIIIMGAWDSSFQMRNFISTPMIGMKRVLARKFKVFSIDEYRTSKLSCYNEEINSNAIVSHHGISRKLHSVLVEKTSGTRYVNRDVNGARNIRKLFHHYIKYLADPDNETPQPLRFTRGYKIPEELLINAPD